MEKQKVCSSEQSGGIEVEDRLGKNTNTNTKDTVGQSGGANGGTEVRDRLGNGSNTNGLLHSKQP